MCRNIYPHTALALTVIGVLGRLEYVQVCDITRPHPGSFEHQTLGKRPLGFQREGVVLMAGAIRHVVDVRILRKQSGLGDKWPSVRHRLVNVVVENSLT